MKSLWVEQALRDGLLLSVFFVGLAVASLFVDPTLRLDDYPPEVQQAYVRAAEGDAVASEAVRAAVGAALIGLVIGGTYLLTRRLPMRRTTRTDLAVRVSHAWLVMAIVHLMDLVVVDGLLLVLLRPDFLVLPGTENLGGYRDWLFGLRSSLDEPQTWVASLIVAVPLGVAAHIFARHQGRSTPRVSDRIRPTHEAGV